MKRVLILFLYLMVEITGAAEPGQKYDFFCKDGQHFRGAVLVKETEKAYIIKLYYSDQEKKILKTEMIKPPQPVDTEAPTLTAEPANGKTLNSISTILVTYSEEVLFADKISSYNLSLAAKNTLAIKEVKQESAASYRLFLSGEPGSGSLALKITGVTDLSGNQLQNNELQYTLDRLSAGVSFNPGNGTVVGELKSIEIKFDKKMQGIESVSNYLLSGPGSRGLSISRVEKKDETASIVYIDGELSDGNIQLSMKNIVDQAGNIPEDAALELIVDKSGPIAETTPVDGSTIGALDQFEVQFNEKVSNALEKANYRVSEGSVADIPLKSIEPVSENRYKITLSKKPRAGSLKLIIENVKDRFENTSKRQQFSWQVEAEGPSTRTLEKLSYWPGTAVYGGGYFSSVQGQMSTYFDAGTTGLLGIDTNFFLKRGPFRSQTVHPLLPSLHFELNYSAFSKNSRTLSGFMFALGPAWFIPFFPSPRARLSLSFSVGYTFFRLKGLTFDGKVQTMILIPELSYQYLFFKRLVAKLFIRENMIVDPSASLYNLALGLAIGYAF